MNTAVSRRRFLRDSALFAGAAGTGALPRIASAAERTTAIAPPTAGALSPVMIGSNDYPDGPCPAAIKAITQIAPHGGRYLREVQLELMTTLAAELRLPVDHLVAYAGSTEPLDYTMLAFTSPGASLVTADPSYESGWRVATRNGAKLFRVPLRKDFSHDVQAMCSADAHAGVICICNPNNPTGSVTARKDLDYALAHKPKGSVPVVDEAYIHFAQSTRSVVDMVAAGEDVVVLRTFSKRYGMAGIRLGDAAARPELVARLMFYGVNSLPVTAAAAGLASLRDTALVPQRRARTAATREDVIGFLRAQGDACTASERNCFMVDVKQPAAGFKDAMASFGVFIGRSWPVWPTWSRITVGTPEEMARFKQAFVQVMAGKRGTFQATQMASATRAHMDAFLRHA